MLAKEILHAGIQAAIAREIADAETRTSGEICIHAEDFCASEAYDRAIKVFQELGLHKTELRNAVMIYIAVHDRKLAIIGDKGIHDWIHDEGWQHLRDALSNAFAKGNYKEGLTSVIHAIADSLAEHFPAYGQIKNELSNSISFPE